MHPILLRNHHFRRGRLAQAIRYGFTNILGTGTLFTDTNGAVPVENLGDAIALATNLAESGPDMLQTVAAKRPTFGRMPSTGMRQMLISVIGPSLPPQLVAPAGPASPGISMVDDSAELAAAGITETQYAIKIDNSERTSSATYTFGGVFTGVPIGMEGTVSAYCRAETGSGRIGIYGASISSYATFSSAEYEFKSSTATPTLNTRPAEIRADAGSIIYIALPQCELGPARTAFQDRQEAWDVVESGVPSVDIAYLNSSEDAFAWPLNAGTYYLFVAGDRGCYFDTVTHLGGEFTVGPLGWSGSRLTHTNARSPLTQLIGRFHVIMPEIRKAPLSELEKQQRVFYAMARGCPGTWVESEELFVPPFTVGGGGALIDHGDGSYTHTPGTLSSLVMQANAAIGEQYIAQFTISNYVAGNVSFKIFSNSLLLTSLESSNTSIRYLTTARYDGQIRLVFSSDFDGTVSNISLKRLTREVPTFPPDFLAWLFDGGESGFANTLGLGTMYSDASGTTSVVNYGDTIALASNLSSNGPNMIQATGPERPVFGRMPISRVRNLCARAGVPSDDFSDAGWTKSGGVVSSEGDMIGSIPAQRFTLVGGNGLHHIRCGMFLTGEAGGLAAWVVDVSGLATKFVAVQLTNPNATGRFTWTGPQTIEAVAHDGIPTVGYTILGDYQAIVWTRFSSARSADSAAILYFGAFGSYSGDGEYATLARVQPEFAIEPTAYQKVTSTYDVTEPGIESADIAYLDGADDNWSWDLAAGTYHLFVAGEKGSLFLTVTHGGGELSVGPVAIRWVGGVSTVLAQLVGQRHVIIPAIRNRELTRFEKQQMVDFAMAKGCPGVWNRSANKLLDGDFSEGATHWTAGELWTFADGTATVENSATAGNPRALRQTGVIQSGAMHIFEYEVLESTFSSNAFLRLSDTTAGGAVISNFDTTGDPGKSVGIHQYSYLSGGTDFLLDYSRSGGGAGEITFDNLAIYELTLESSPT